MAKARSPEYPAVSLKEAVDRVKMIYEKDYQNRLPKQVIAEHMGYKGLSGASLPVLSALTKYGLLEGRGDETRVSDLAVKILAHGVGTPERIEALKQAATAPELFADMDLRFQGGKASDQAIRSFLLTNKFIPSAADAAIRSYRETKQLVESESGGYNSGESETAIMHAAAPTKPATSGFEGLGPIPEHLTRPITEKFTLDEGEVTLTVPQRLSLESYQDLEDRIEILLRGLKRRAEQRDRLRKMAASENEDDEAAN